MLDRKVAPALNEIKSYDLPVPNKYTLDNGIPVYEVNMGTQAVLKVELVFHSGRWYENHQLASKMTAGLLREGTSAMSGAKVAEQIDFFGASIRFLSNLDTGHIQLYCLTKHLRNILPILEEILSKPSFPEDEILAYIQRNQERLKVDLEDSDTVAYRKLTEMLYGSYHPYGYNSTPEMYHQVQRSHLLEHYKNNYVAGNCLIMVTGQSSTDTISLLNKHLGQVIPKGKSERKNYELAPTLERQLILPKKNSLQSAIRIGKQLFNRHHPDYQKMYILNTILGGYFGSRLMQNLREEKGYTYNIYSTVDPMLWDGYFFVGTEVKSDIKNEAIQEIYSEFERLREETIPSEELEMVRNYLLGTLLSALDGAFSIGEVIKMSLINNLPLDYYSSLIETIKDITSTDLQALANHYLQEDTFYEVIVG